MASRIIFLGTAGDGIIFGKQHRASGGIILDVDGNFFHINPGPGALVRAMQFNINLRQNLALLVSSKDLLDSNDVNAVIETMTYSGMDRRGVLIAHQDAIDKCLSEYHKEQLSKIIAAQPEKKLGIENVDINILKTTSDSQVGFKISTPDLVLSYSGCTGYQKELAEQYKDSDVLILNVTNPADTLEKDQLNTRDAIEIAKQVKPKLIIMTHFGVKMIKADPMCEAREVQRASQVQVVAAKDGFILSPFNYDTGVKQKTLLDVNQIKEEKVESKDLDSEELY